MHTEFYAVPEDKKPRGRPPKEQTAFGEWLRTHPTWTRATIAKEAGLSESHVKGLCNGHQQPSRTVALAIAKITNDEFGLERWGVPFEE